MTSLRIGTSGWVYPHWRQRFYPRGLSQARWLEYFATQFPTVEVNNTFYRLPAAEVFRGWRGRTPRDFVFAVKASRYITHIKRLRHAAPPVRTFLRRARYLGDKLGPVLFQLPPRFPVDLPRLEEFLKRLPKGVRAVMEFRDPSWHVEDVFDLLEGHSAAYCIMVAPRLPCVPRVTGGLLYTRFHAPAGGGQAFGRRRLQEWADRIRVLMRGARQGYVYFNNDVGGAAVEDARTLRELLDL